MGRSVGNCKGTASGIQDVMITTLLISGRVVTQDKKVEGFPRVLQILAKIRQFLQPGYFVNLGALFFFFLF